MEFKNSLITHKKNTKETLIKMFNECVYISDKDTAEFLPHTQTSLSPDENVRAKEGGKKTTPAEEAG